VYQGSSSGGSQNLQSVATEGNTTTLGLNASSFGVLSSDSLRAVIGYSLDGNFNKYGYLVLRPKTDLTSGGSADGGMFYIKSDKLPYYYHDDTGEIPLSGSGTDDLLDMDLDGLVDLDYLIADIVGADTILKRQTPDITPTNGSGNLITSDAVYAAVAAKEATFTETTQEFTGSTSLTLTLSNTLKTSKAVIVYYNGLEMANAAFSASGTTVTLSGLTRETSDRIKVKYSY
jgi:hypothetical protein